MHIKYVEFHITNVCDISCTNCNKFNNYNFKGSQTWSSVKDTYAKWAKLIMFDEISIVGGEPFTNLDLPNWIFGIRQLWPNARISVATNGNKLSKFPAVISAVRENNVRLRISIHSIAMYEKIIASLDEVLIKPVTKSIQYAQHNIDAWQQTYNAIKAEHWPSCNNPTDFDSLPYEIKKECKEVFNFSKSKFDTYEALNELVDAEGLVADLLWYTHFHQSALIYDAGKFKLRNNDPVKAVNNCDQKFCHSFKDGKFYKCALGHALPEAIAQFKIDISEEDRAALQQFIPADVDWDVEQLNKYVANLQNADPISLCKFCPESYTNAPIGGVTKKKY